MGNGAKTVLVTVGETRFPLSGYVEDGVLFVKLYDALVKTGEVLPERFQSVSLVLNDVLIRLNGTSDACYYVELSTLATEMENHAGMFRKFSKLPAALRSAEEKFYHKQVEKVETMEMVPAGRTEGIEVCGTYIRQDAHGRYCLNDLHKASGGEKRHQASDWLQLINTKELIAELLTPEITGIKPVESTAGRYGGTYVCKELVYAYAMWISAKFHLQVIRTFDAVVTDPMQPAQQFQLPQTYAEALRALADTSEKVEQLRVENAKVSEALEDAQPKVKVYDEIVASEELLSMDTTAKLIGVKPRRFGTWLRANRFLRSDNAGRNQPYAPMIDNGYMVTKEYQWVNGIHSGVSPVAYFTQKGMLKMQDLITKLKERAPEEYDRWFK